MQTLREFLRYLRLELYRSDHTVEAYSSDLRGFNDFLHNSGVPQDDAGFFVPDAVTTADIREWVAALSESGIGNTSLRRKIQSLRAFFKFLVKRGILSSSPAAAIPLPKKSRHLPEVASSSEVEKVISGEQSALKSLALELLFGCGLRRSELLSITDESVNPYSRELRILGKGNKERVIPLTDGILGRIQEWQRLRDEEYPDLPSPRKLMVTRSGGMSASTLYRIVHEAMEPTTASRKSPHTLRHSFATTLLNSGADINSVKELLGHSSLAATEIYTHVAFADLKKDYGKAHPRAKKGEK